MTEEERIFRGELFASEEPELVEKKRRAHRLSQKYNETFEDDAEVREAILRELLGELGEGVCMLGPVRFHYGCHTRVGNHCFMNFNFTVQDDALVTIGDHCNFGPNVTIVTPMHPMLPDERRGMVCDDGVERFLCYAKPVTIGHDCWFGANVVVCPGVTIGENCVIGAGSVVTRDIPAGSFAAGNPATMQEKKRRVAAYALESEMAEAIRIIDGRAETECSGNMTKENIATITKLGVDYVSSGALTHSAPILDLSLKHLRAL